MKARVGASDKVAAMVESSKMGRHNVNINVRWSWEHFRNGKLLDAWEYDNVCTDEGLNHMLDVTFHGTTPISPWYVEIFEDDVTPTAATTYAVPVYTPSIAYDEATRPEYVEAAAASKVTTNAASKAVFTINSTKTIYGASLVGGGLAATTKGDVAGGGTLFSGSKFGAAKSVIDNDVLNVTIAITLANS